MTDIRVVCPCCGVSLRAKAQLAGQTIRCPKCVSLVPIKPSEDDFAQPVEANYDAVPLEENNIGRICPKCSTALKPGGKLCKQCGWHLELETYFEDLKEENLVVREEPKTKWETWFENQLHETSRPRDVLNYSAIAGGVLSIIFLAAAHLRFGMWGLLLSPLLIVAWIGWYRFMQLIGLMHDPTRKRILEKERAEREARPAPSSSAPAVEAAAVVAATAPVRSTKPNAAKPSSAAPLSFDLPEAELPGQAKPKTQAKPASPQTERKVVRPAATGQPATTAAGPKQKPKPAAPSAPAPKPVAETPAKPKPAEDDWLNDLL